MRYARITPSAVPGAGAPVPWIMADDSLARGPGSRFLVAGWPGLEQLTQAINYLNNPYQTNLSWGNRDIRFTLVCEYEFASESDCFVFVTTLPLRCPLTGFLEMGVIGTDGASVVYPNAHIKRVLPTVGQSDPQVVSMRLQYDIEAGAPGSVT